MNRNGLLELGRLLPGMHKSILIIGAGAAGLAAARWLGRAGREVTVLEARDRVGGRVFTSTERQSPVPVELGAEFVHGKSVELFERARAVNLELTPVSNRHWYFENDQLSRSHAFWKQIEGLMDQMNSLPADQSVKQFLDSLPDDSQRAKAMLARYVEGFHAADLDQIGIKGLRKANEAADAIEGDKAFRFVRGYKAIIDAMRAEAESYGVRIQTGIVVTEIHWQRERVDVVCESREGADSYPQTFSAAAAIVTLPLAVLQSGAVRFVPDLPPAKSEAIRQLKMGNVVKLNLHFRERFWEDVKVWDERAEPADFSDAGFFHAAGLPLPTWWTQLPVRAPLLVGWAGGPHADRLLQTSGAGSASIEQSIVEQGLYSLSHILNLPVKEISDQLTGFNFHNWQKDVFARGAYSYIPVNGLASQGLLAESLEDTLYFAGEAMSIGHIGTVHGAMQTGYRAAGEVLSR